MHSVTLAAHAPVTATGPVPATATADAARAPFLHLSPILLRFVVLGGSSPHTYMLNAIDIRLVAPSLPGSNHHGNTA